jgi:hypothetical protein
MNSPVIISPRSTRICPPPSWSSPRRIAPTACLSGVTNASSPSVFILPTIRLVYAVPVSSEHGDAHGAQQMQSARHGLTAYMRRPHWTRPLTLSTMRKGRSTGVYDMSLRSISSICRRSHQSEGSIRLIVTRLWLACQHRIYQASQIQIDAAVGGEWRIR